MVIYQAPNGSIELRGDFSHETVWATQAQIAEVFGVDRSVVTKHIKNLFKDGELAKKAMCKKCTLLIPINQLPYTLWM